jgi:hypothetical protein
MSASETPATPQPCIPATTAAKTVEPMTPYYLEAVKILGTGNSAGLFGALVAYYYFARAGYTVLHWTTFTASAYLAGVALFTMTFFCLYAYCVWQVGPSAEKPQAPCRRKLWRDAALTFGAFSFLAWWVGTALAIKVLCALPNPFPLPTGCS